MKVIGLTGNIASGKSTVAKLLQGYGCLLIDADQVGRDVVEPGRPAWNQLRRTFGDSYFFADGSLNRKKLGAYVFGNPAALATLNSITHPAIEAEIEDRLKKYGDKQPEGIAVVEAAVLLEAKMFPDIEYLWVVAADDSVRLQRAVERDGLTEQQAKDRMARQMSQEEKMKYADYIVHNNGSIECLRAKTAAVWRQFLQDIATEIKEDRE